MAESSLFNLLHRCYDFFRALLHYNRFVWQFWSLIFGSFKQNDTLFKLIDFALHLTYGLIFTSKFILKLLIEQNNLILLFDESTGKIRRICQALYKSGEFLNMPRAKDTLFLLQSQ